MKNKEISLAGSGPCGSNYEAGSNNLSGNAGHAGVSGVQTNGGAGAILLDALVRILLILLIYSKGRKLQICSDEPPWSG